MGIVLQFTMIVIGNNTSESWRSVSFISNKLSENERAQTPHQATPCSPTQQTTLRTAVIDSKPPSFFISTRHHAPGPDRVWVPPPSVKHSPATQSRATGEYSWVNITLKLLLLENTRKYFGKTSFDSPCTPIYTWNQERGILLTSSDLREYEVVVFVLCG